MKHLIPEFEKLRARYPAGFESSFVLPCLRRIQEDRGYVADSDIDALVEYLGVPRIQIEEVLSYYTQFRRKAIGRWHIQACRNLSCSLLGSERLIGHLTKKLGIVPGQTTADGRFTLSTVECVASCGRAPVVMINETYHVTMSPETIDAVLDKLA
jgi:NADH-quinone oxidoreductase subunit E